MSKICYIPTHDADIEIRKKETATTITLARPIKALVSKPYMFFYVATMQEYLYCQHSSMKVANTEV
jgi:hypothetical protein